MKSDTTEANKVKKAQKRANLERIATAIERLQADGLPVNVQSVARAAQVSADTVRRSGDAYREIRRLRSSQPPATRASATQVPAAAHAALKARHLALQDENRDLRRDLKAAQRALHQALGEAPTGLSATEADEVRRDHAELSVLVAELQKQVAELKDERTSLADELAAAHEVNREYVRDLTRVQEQLRDADRNLVAMRRAQ